MAQQRISFSIATHPPVHPPVASPAEPSTTPPPPKARNGKGHNGHSHAAKPKNGSARADAAHPGAGHNGAGHNGAGHNGAGHNGAANNAAAHIARPPAAERGAQKAAKAKLAKTKPAKRTPPRYPAATQALLPARANLPLLPAPRHGILDRIGHSTGAAAGLAAAFAAVILGVAWILQTTFDPEGELSADAASLVARISPSAGSRLSEGQLRGLSERLADIEHSTFRKRYTRTIHIGRGDRLLQLLILEGVPRQEAFEAIQVLAKVYDTRKLKTGQPVELVHGIVDHVPQSFVGLRFQLGNGAREITVMRQGTGPFTATDVKKQLRPELVRGTGRIETSLYVAGLKAGVPPEVMIQLIQIYSFDVDFQREIRKGDTFRVLFRNYYDEDGKLVRQGDILYAAMTLGGKDLELFRFTPRNGHMDYFTAQGHNVRKALMRTPIDGAHLSSRFGRRRHPILGYTRFHRGVDFAAPPGTPIYAAGDGIIVTRVRASGYGNYIKIHHNTHYDTAYAHMQRFAVGLAAGSRVRQGQVIGYVGSTGQSTGPHLHYEVHFNGVPVNPLSIRLPAGRKLAGIDLQEFMVRRTLTRTMFLNRAKDVRIASAPRRQVSGPSN
jgi:murein DD-endopeptidase MepM/ murein hydrolase activator NlpD